MLRHYLVVVSLLLAAGCSNSGSPVQVSAPNGLDSGFVADGDYQALDLGTLGGGWAKPTAINDAGQIAGVSQTALGLAHAFLWENGVMRDLGPRGESEAHVINARGQVAGASTQNGWARVFLWDSDVMRDLGPDNARFVVARSLSASGDVVATVWYDNGRVSAVVWRAGVMQDLGSLNPDASETYAAAADEARLVAGASIAFAAGPTPYHHPFLWDGSQLRDLGVLGAVGDAALCVDSACSQGMATDVNSVGQVIGWSTDSTGLLRAFLWRNGTMGDLGAFPSQPTWAVSLNDRGQVAGDYYDYGTGPRGFIWEDGIARDLGSLGGGRTGVVAINEEGLIAGYGATSSGDAHAFIWRAGRMYDLGPGSPTALNERGDVVGVTTRLSPDAPRAILWRRVPPPVPLAF